MGVGKRHSFDVTISDLLICPDRVKLDNLTTRVGDALTFKGNLENAGSGPPDTCDGHGFILQTEEVDQLSPMLF